MKVQLTIILLSTLFSFIEGEKSSRRFYYGDKVPNNTYPYNTQVRLEVVRGNPDYGDEHVTHCTGTLVSRIIVLTAGSCIANDPIYGKVQAIAIVYNQQETGETGIIQVKWELHPNYINGADFGVVISHYALYPLAVAGPKMWVSNYDAIDEKKPLRGCGWGTEVDDRGE